MQDCAQSRRTSLPRSASRHSLPHPDQDRECDPPRSLCPDRARQPESCCPDSAGRAGFSQADAYRGGAARSKVRRGRIAFLPAGSLAKLPAESAVPLRRKVSKTADPKSGNPVQHRLGSAAALEFPQEPYPRSRLPADSTRPSRKTSAHLRPSASKSRTDCVPESSLAALPSAVGYHCIPSRSSTRDTGLETPARAACISYAPDG